MKMKLNQKKNNNVEIKQETTDQKQLEKNETSSLSIEHNTLILNEEEINHQIPPQETEEKKNEKQETTENVQGTSLIRILVNHKEDDNQYSQKIQKSKVINENLLRAFQYFDKNRVGYIRTEDFSHLLHCIGHHLSNNIVQELIDKIAVGRRIKYDELV